MLHGFGNDKHEWESTTDEGDGADKYHWNNHWFAKHGYYVLSYTARGFPTTAPRGLASRRRPVRPERLRGPRPPRLHPAEEPRLRDPRHAVARRAVAATYPDVDPDRIAVTGGSYGGIESWLQASQATWTFPHQQDRVAARPEPAGGGAEVPVHRSRLLARAERPRRRPGARTTCTSRRRASRTATPATGNPIGAPKASYIDGLFALGDDEGHLRGRAARTTRPAPVHVRRLRGAAPDPGLEARTDGGDPTPDATR